MTDCIFCKILKGEVPCKKVYEDRDFTAFLDIAPINKGHTLVVPKKHTKDLFEMQQQELKKLMLTIQKIAAAVMKAVDADGINIGMNNKPAAGQLVIHSHLHVIPRFANDGLRHWPGRKLPDSEMKDIQKAVCDALQ